jgi:hypothetical protein
VAVCAVELLMGSPPTSRPDLFLGRADLPGAAGLVSSRCLDEDPFVRMRTPAALAERLAGCEDVGGFRSRAAQSAQDELRAARETMQDPRTPRR